MSLWPLRLSIAALVSLFAAIGTLTVCVLAVNLAIPASVAMGIDAAVIPIAAAFLLIAPCACIGYPLVLIGDEPAYRESQAMATGVACLCAAAFLLTA